MSKPRSAPEKRLKKEIWSYHEGSGLMPEHERMMVASWYKNAAQYNIHIVSSQELKEQVPATYLPDNFDQIQDAITKSEIAGVALVRKHGGVYLSTNMLLHGSEALNALANPIDLKGANFSAVYDEDEEEFTGHVFAAPSESPVITRLNARMVRNSMGFRTTLNELVERNKEVGEQMDKGKIHKLSAKSIFLMASEPDMAIADLPKHQIFLVTPEIANGRGVPGSSMRHILDTNSGYQTTNYMIAGEGRAREVEETYTLDPTEEKVPVIGMFIFLFLGMSFLLYASQKNI
jgi:hypothetical protein